MGGAYETYRRYDDLGVRTQLEGCYGLEKTLRTTGHGDHLFAFGSDVGSKCLFEGFHFWTCTRPIIGKDLSYC